MYSYRCPHEDLELSSRVWILLRGSEMQSDPLCPACTQAGQLVGRDARGRELFACLTATCDVVEYDREVIRLREGSVAGPASQRPRQAREPAYWSRPEGVGY